MYGKGADIRLKSGTCVCEHDTVKLNHFLRFPVGY